MVEIKYCPDCGRAKREHFSKSTFCRYCGSDWEPVDVPRSRYFVVMLPFWVLGVILHLWVVYDLFSKIDDSDALRSERFTMMGIFILGLASYIFAIGFQFLDSKAMEKEAEQLGKSTEGHKDQVLGRRSALAVRGPPVEKEVPVRRPRGKPEPDGDVPAEKKSLFVKKPKKPEDVDEEEKEGSEEKPSKRRGWKKEENGEEAGDDEKPGKTKSKPGKKSKAGKKKSKPGKKKSKPGKKEDKDDPVPPPRKVARKIRTR